MKNERHKEPAGIIEKKPGKLAKGLANVGGAIVSAPGIAIDFAGKLGGGILKCGVKVLDRAGGLVVDIMELPSKYFLENAEETENEVGSFANAVLGVVTAVPGMAVAIPVALAYGILKGTGIIVEKAGELVSLPFKLAGEGIKKLGSRKKLKYVESAENEMVAFE